MAYLKRDVNDNNCAQLHNDFLELGFISIAFFNNYYEF